MPSNIIQINGDKKLRWIVPDSRMDAIITGLDMDGEREEDSSTKSPLKNKKEVGKTLPLSLSVAST